jgi:NAD+ synthase (glutamine-hydrolysing)
MYGFYRLATAVPEIRVADIEFNTAEIIELAKQADKQDAALVLFPEMSVSGYTCADLFHQPLLIDASLKAVKDIALALKNSELIIVVGACFTYQNGLYNCAFVLHRGQIKGIVPKTFNPNYREFYEKRWFKSGAKIRHETVGFDGYDVPFGTDLVFKFDDDFSFGVEICEDFWSVIPPSSYQAIAGATVNLNLSASNELVAKADYRRDLVVQQSARCVSAYIYASAGVHESTTDLVFGGHAIIAENGAVLTENERFQRKGAISFADIDCRKLKAIRFAETSFSDCELPEDRKFDYVNLEGINRLKDIEREIDAEPFVPSNQHLRDLRCREIYNIQSAGLAKRFEHTGAAKAVIGISGGLDSTLALLICAETFKLIGKDLRDIIAITMPGFGTTGRTYKNAIELCSLLGVELREIDIKAACLDHFKEIGHSPEVHDVTYENVQARERTQVLMDIANRENGLVIGTGDLSEIALGWSTYNGDHMSMYAVNCSVPKTLIRYLIKWEAERSSESLKNTLLDIIDTPVSPELLPKKSDDEIHHRTEDIVGPYELHDFFLYHFIKYGAEPDKIKFMAQKAFKDKYDADTIQKWLKLFFKRFFTQQFKRSCIPDGPKIGSINLSPRGDWRMPSDAVAKYWLDSI